MNTPNEPGPVSPELVLVDPSLAELVRSPTLPLRLLGVLRVPGVNCRRCLRSSPRTDRTTPSAGHELPIVLRSPAQDQPFAWPPYESAAAVAPIADETPEPTVAAPAPARRRAITPVRAGGIFVAVLALAGAGTALGALISQSSRDSGRTEADLWVPSNPRRRRRPARPRRRRRIRPDRRASRSVRRESSPGRRRTELRRTRLRCTKARGGSSFGGRHRRASLFPRNGGTKGGRGVSIPGYTAGTSGPFRAAPKNPRGNRSSRRFWTIPAA